MDKRVFGNCVIIVFIWLCNRLAYYYLSKYKYHCEWHYPDYWLLNNVEV